MKEQDELLKNVAAITPLFSAATITDKSKQDMESNLEPAFFARTPTVVRYASTVSAKDYQEIEAQKFARDNGMQGWTNSILISSVLRNKLWMDTTYPKKRDQWHPLIEHRMLHPLDSSFVIFNINSDIGKGVRLALDAAPIPCGSMIGIYAGGVQYDFPYTRTNTETHTKIDIQLPQDPYAVGMGSTKLVCEEHQQSILTQSFTWGAQVSGRSWGNITRWLQDAPSIEELERVRNLSRLEKSNIATANVMIYPTLYYGCPMHIMFAMKNIQPGEIVVWSYDDGEGGSYWKENQRRCVFNKEGEIIGHFEGKHKIALEANYKASQERAAPRVNMDFLQQSFKRLNSPNCFQECFIENVQASLRLWENRFRNAGANNPDKQCIDNLIAGFNQKVIHEKNAAEERYEFLRRALQQNPAVLRGDLRPLGSELCFYMKTYKSLIPSVRLSIAATVATAATASGAATPSRALR